MINTLELETLANEAAGNWQHWSCFAWFGKPDNAEQFTLVYTSNRDSDTLDLANAKAIDDELSQFIDDGDVIRQSHSHWAVGHVDGYAIRVRDENGITAAFRCWCALQEKLADYPILDESLFSEMEMESQNESWQLWAQADFRRAIERSLDVEIDSAADLSEIFQTACDRSNTYWEGDSIDVERAADVVTLADVAVVVEGGAE
jgi:hypothetical protein